MVDVLVTDEQEDHRVDASQWLALAEKVLEAEGVASASELSMAFVSEPVMADLNRRFAGEEGSTDVLAFPIDEEPVQQGPSLLGDLVICPAVAGRNAPQHAGTLDDELALLVVHGILHLLGMDHADEAEAGEMRRRECGLLDRFHRVGARALR